MASDKQDFLKRTFQRDLSEAAISTFSSNLEVKHTFEEEINPEQKAQKLRIKKKARRKLIITIVSIVIILLILTTTFAYFFYISPVFIRKPVIEKPTLNEDSPSILSDHVSYIVNELGGYKLHGGPFGSVAQMELFLSDINKHFTITVKNHEVYAVGGEAPSPDVRFSAKEKVFLDLFKADDMISEAKKLVELEIIKVEPLFDETVLSLKGYKAIYDNLSGKTIGTRSLFKLTPAIKKLIYLITVAIVAILGIIYVSRK